MNYEKKILPWSVIIILAVLFFPIAIYLMFYKLHNEKYNYSINGRKVVTVGKCIMGFGLFYMFIVLTDLSWGRDISGVFDTVIMSLIVFVGGGYATMRNGKKYIRIGQDYSEYINIIRNSVDGSIDDISWKKLKSFDATCTDLQKMIDDNILENTYIDRVNRVIVSPLIPKRPKVVVENVKAEMYVPVKCPNCGGNNSVGLNKIAECEYCGSSIKGV